jgi:leader peptidase (prepilin peptidase)/N-methyltransferase
MNDLFFQTIFMFFIGGISLAVGSFLNVVIVRLPSLLLTQNLSCQTNPQNLSDKTMQYINSVLKTLSFPRSHCQSCKKQLGIYDLIPIISYIFLKAKCRYCKVLISPRYPIVEALTLFLSLLIALRFDISPQTFPALLLTWSCIALAFIDFEHLVLPNIITLPFIGLGLIINFFGILQSFHDSLLGAIFGYLFLWGIYHFYKFLTGKVGLGFGDIKFLSMLGAWLGWKMLVFILFFSSIIGATWGIILIGQGRASRNTPLPFGICLAISGIIVLLLDSILKTTVSF